MASTSTATPRLIDWKRPIIASISALVALILGFALPASADTLLMPNRDFLMAPVSEVVWGVTTLPNHSVNSPTTYTLSFGDGSANATGNVTDRSYIAVNHAFIAAGTFTVTLQVTNGGTTETATTTVRVFDPSVESAERIRGVNTNRAIEDGLRYLWTAQFNRAATFPASATTHWAEHTYSFAALVVLAFENHGYHLPNNDDAPTGLYERFVVQRGLNFVMDSLQQINLTPQAAGNPCVGAGSGPDPDGAGAAVCVGLRQAYESEGYATALAILPLAGSNALNRHVAGITGSQNAGYVVGRTYGEILQRLVNAMAWGQGEVGNGRGGWYYSFNAGGTDGSTIGWNVLALLDAAAAGVEVPAFVKNEFVGYAIPLGLNMHRSGPNNIDGTFDYSADNNPDSSFAGTGGPNMAKNGIGLQAMFYADMVGLTDAQVVRARNSISNRWNAPVSGDTYACGNGQYNKGCGYAMFNVFKALKLQGITTLPSVTRPAGPGAIPASDWYADYVDWLLTNQVSPTLTTGGHWSTLYFSCCGAGTAGSTALAELILSPVALIAPDPTLFSTVGLGPATALIAPFGTHTVTATATSAGGAAVAGATVNFEVLTGPNAGATGSGITNPAGQATFTYTDTGGPGRDTIQAFIGTLGSNVVEALWQVPSCAPTAVSATLTTPMYPIDQGWRAFTINGAPGATVTQVCQDEPPNFENIAAWAIDADGVGTSAASVRAQRSGTRTAPGNGRVYHVYFTSSSCTGTVTIGVPTTSGGTAVDNGPLYNSVTGAACAVPTVPTVVATPNVVGSTEAVASATIIAASLQVGQISHLNHPSIPAGSVLSQVPAAGVNVALGSAVALTISSGPSSVAVPNVVGTSQSVGSSTVTGAGLGVSVTTVNDAVIPAGLVIAQAPIGGTQVPPGSTVDLTVSLGPAMSTVPNVVGLPLAGAVSTVGGAGLNFGTVNLVYDPVVPDGRVILQTPPAGTLVAPGSFVNFDLSLGPQPVPVPNVIGQSEAAASASIVASTHVVGTVGHLHDPTVPEGQVFLQNPPGGALAVPGASVNFTVSLGPVMVGVPDVVGQVQATAQANLIAAGLSLGAVSTTHHPSVPTGLVISQNPAGGPGVTAILGSAVTLAVSLGPQPVPVPNVVGQPQATAGANIVAATLTLGSVTTANSPTVPAGDVISQNPIAGTLVLPNSAVDIVVSLGPVMAIVPNVVSSAEASAVAALLAANLSVGVSYAADAMVPQGDVISQNPSGGATVPEGSTVDIVVSTGPVAAIVPNVVGQLEATANANIVAASLAVGTTTSQHSPTVAIGRVISQTPVGGATATLGSAVSLVISLGPEPAVPSSLDVNLSSLVLGSGGSTQITSTVYDGLAVPIVPTLPVTYQVLAGAGAIGTLPTIVGNQVVTAADTRGTYTLRGTVDGTAITDDQGFAVLNGDSVAASNAAKFVKLGLAESAVSDAIKNLLGAYQSVGTPADVTAATTALTGALVNVPMTGRNAIQRSTAVAPEHGFLPSTGALAAAGFPLTAGDVAFGNVVDQIGAKILEIAAFFDGLDPDATAGGTNSVAELNALNNQLAALKTQLDSITVTPHGIVRSASAINRLMGNKIPAHLHALVNRAVSIANQYPNPAALPAGVARMRGAEQFFAELREKNATTPAEFYARTDPAFFGLLGLMSGVSAQMHLVNELYGEIMWEVSDMMSVMIVNGVLTSYLNSAALGDIISGASLSFHAPGIGGSTIEGYGIDPFDAASSETWFIGTEVFSQIRELIQAFDPSQVEGPEDLWSFFNGIADAVDSTLESYDRAHTQPDSVYQGFCLFDDSSSCVSLWFNNGFPDVNSTRFPAPVIILLHNMNNGSWGQGIFNFVP